LEVAKLLLYQLPCMLDKGIVPNYQSSMEKIFISELSQHIARIGMEVMGMDGQLIDGSKYAPFDGDVPYYYRLSVIETIYGGTNEIQRNIIALRGLGLPRG
ncbi:acyl-CoA dehydrogenase family protein, partial [Thermodesulfobacteriota bacterium]